MSIINKLDNLSFIIPTKDRPAFLERSLRYYSDSYPQLNIIVVDSSIKFKKLNSDLVKKFQPNKTYIHSPNVSPDKAILIGLLKCKTNFSVFIADDDILMLNTVEHCLNLLKSNPNLIATYGNYIQIGIFPNSKSFTHGKIRSIKLIKTKNYLESSATERISKFYSGSQRDPLVFCIAKTQTQIHIFKKTSSLDFSQRHVISEILHANTILSLGPVKKVNKVFLIRQSHPENSFHSNKLSQWLLLPDYYKSLKKIQQSVGSNHQILTKIFNDLNLYLIKKLVPSNKLTQKKIMTFFKPYIPLFLVRGIYFKNLQLDQEIMNFFYFIKKSKVKIQNPDV